LRQGQLAHNILQQGAGRIWVPDAVLRDFSPGRQANLGMDIQSDLAHGFTSDAELAYHYQGPVQRILSDDSSTYLYQIQAQDGKVYSMGASRSSDMRWVDWNTLSSGIATWSDGMDLSSSSISATKWVGDSALPATMSVVDRSGIAYLVGDKWQADITMTVFSDNQMPVAGVTVSGVWAYGDPASCMTDIDGRCTVTSKTLRSRRDKVKFTVENVSHPTIVYDVAGNTVDTALRVFQP
jgi:hypothetical protein